MKWFALLGREKKLCIAELASKIGSNGFDICGSVAVGDGSPPNWNELGGIVRAGSVIGSVIALKSLAMTSVKLLDEPKKVGKTNIGLSSNRLSKKELGQIGRDIKSAYQEHYAKKPRIVYPLQGSLLNAGHFQSSKLDQLPNTELFIINNKGNWMIGQTKWQQDINAYKKRDRDRPARDARVGMLPPKLAQIMLNLASVDTSSHIHDPFCGSGVILSEALLKNAAVSGSDASEDMVRATKINLSWIEQQYSLESTNHEIFVADARNVHLPMATTHIVSEGYLGNPNLRESSEERLQEEASNLHKLYQDFFQNLTNFNQKLTIVFALPVWFWHEKAEPIHIPIIDDLSDMGYTIEQFAPDGYNRLVYRRPHQTVGRAIIKLKKG
jgi:tRNA G10  N-methylase Trm11